MLKANSVTKTFAGPAGEVNVLRGVDLNVERGEMVGVMGASGVGKSTLLHILGTLDRPTNGKIFIDGTDVTALSDQELTAFRNRSIGFVFQFHHLLPEFSAVENVMMPSLISARGSYDDAHKQAAALLGELGLGHRLEHRPGELSGGEQQRVAVARALIENPSLVLADEPTGNLDTHTGNELFGLLKEINLERGTTFIIATHNEHLASMCHRILRMADGRLS